MAEKINIDEENEFSPIVCEPDSDDDVADTISPLQNLHITDRNDEFSVTECDMNEQLCACSEEFRDFMKQLKKKGSTKSEELSVDTSSESLVPFTSHGLGAYIEPITLSSDQDASSAYDCAHFADEVQVIKNRSSIEKHLSLEKLGFALNEIEENLPSSSGFTGH